MGVVGGGGGNVFLAYFQHIFSFRKTILFHLMFSSCFCMLDLFPTFLDFFWKYWKVPLHLLVEWEVVYPNIANSRYRGILT